MVTEDLLIHELAQRAGISVRTIRYYIEEGLLPQPSYQGKYSYYTPEYLERLELIRRLKESYLPLREIRAILSSLTDDEVHLKLTELPASGSISLSPPTPAQPVQKPGDEALQYINRLMEDQTRYKSNAPANKNQPNITHPGTPQAQPTLSIHESPGFLDEENWQHILLAPGVELHLRRPLPPQLEAQVRQILSYARKIFTTKS